MSDGLVVEGLNAYYGGAHVVQDVSFTLEGSALAVVGRNGMGKTTLCQAIMGLVPLEPGGRVTGSVRLNGHELVGRPVHKIAATGIAYVPQGRRIFPSLSTDEHLRMVARRSSPWTVGRVYDLFPRLAERKRIGASRLSGGEQQMLAIGRALMTNPSLIMMDEPSEGLAPTVVAELIENFSTLEREGLRALVVEQNLGVATALSSRLLVMVNGALATETTAAELTSSADLRNRYLGVAPTA